MRIDRFVCATAAVLSVSVSFLLPLMVSAGDSVPPVSSDDKKIGTVSVNGKSVSMPVAYVNRLNKLKSKGVIVFYPAFVPATFTLSSVKIVEDEDKDHPDYAIEFRNKKNLHFSIESAYSGIGDGPDGYKRLKGKSRELGAFGIDVLKPHAEGNGTKDVYYISDWLSDKPRLAGEKRLETMPPGRSHHFLGSGITDVEAVKIVESLAPIK